METKAIWLKIDQWRDDLCRVIRARVPPHLRRVLSEDDILQEVWLDAHRGMADFVYVDEETTKRWIFTVARRRALTMIRSYSSVQRGAEYYRRQSGEQSFLETLLQHSGTPSRVAIDTEMKDWLRSRLADVQEPHRSMLLLHFIEGLPYEDIADHFRTTPGTVRTTIYKVLQKLRSPRLGRSGS